MVKKHKEPVTTKDIHAELKELKSSNWNNWQKRIFIAVPTTGLVRVEWMMARFGQVIPCNWSNTDFLYMYSQYSPMGFAVADARNVCVQKFMEQGHEWLLFIDHDVILPPDAFLKMNEYMMKGDVPVVCGLYYCKGSHPEPLLFRGRGNSYYDKWKPGQKVWVDGIPMGITLIHKSIMKVVYDSAEQYSLNTLQGQFVAKRVFETPRESWFDPLKGQYQKRVGTEDLLWCDRVMQENVFEKCGVEKFKKFGKKKYPFLLDTSIFCRHINEQGQMFPSGQSLDAHFQRGKKK